MSNKKCEWEWEWKKLKDICEKGSSNIKQGDLKGVNGDYPIYGASGFIQNVDFYQQSQDYIGIIKDGSGVGRTMFLPAYSSVIGTLQYILPKEGNSIKFVNYALQNIDFSKLIQGAAIPHIYFKDYGETDIAVPPLAEQERIVKVLDDAFAKIDKIKTDAETNLQNAKDLFQTTLANELSITDEKIKQGWVETTIGKACRLISGDSNNNKLPDGKVPYVKVGDMNLPDNLESITSSNRFVKMDLSDKRIFPVGTIIFPKRGGAILTNKKRITSIPICCDLNIMGVIPQNGVYAQYLKFYFENIDFSKIFNGAAIPQINNCDISPLLIHLPPLSIQKQIVSKLDSLSEKVKQLESNYKQVIADCDELKKSILKKAFEGNL